MTSIFGAAEHPATSHIGARSTATENKWVLARQLALVCCRDLSAFEQVEHDRFKHFLLQRKAIVCLDELPCARTLARSALNDVYDETRALF